MSAAPQTNAFDLDEALCRLDGDRELLAEIAAIFLDELEPLVGRLREAVEQENAKSVRELAHAMKGSVANFSAAESQQLAGKLEAMGRDSHLEGAPEILGALESELGRLRPALRDFIVEVAG